MNFYIKAQTDILKIAEASLGTHEPPAGLKYFEDGNSVWFNMGAYAYRILNSVLFLDCNKLAKQSPIKELTKNTPSNGLLKLNYTGMTRRIKGNRICRVFSLGESEFMYEEKLLKKFPAKSDLYSCTGMSAAIVADENGITIGAVVTAYGK